MLRTEAKPDDYSLCNCIYIYVLLVVHYCTILLHHPYKYGFKMLFQSTRARKQEKFH